MLVLAPLAGCRGQQSAKPPLRVFPDMDEQPRFNPQAENRFYSDARAMRQPPEGTVPRGRAVERTVMNSGLEADGSYATLNPLFWDEDVNGRLELMRRGRERFNIYCAVCHDQAGTGRGIVMPGGPAQYQGFPPPPSLHDDRIRQMADGEIFTVISNGVRNMPGYRTQVGEADRWAIIAYLRALQRSQGTTIADVPPQRRQELDVRP